ncbi:MAG TPA: alpha/beta hydrolase-fold protein [Verrucomicrobiae bacterium]|nr:alpha/beta hydrolase-fold protein [Verrucomicrobiae bacterium]
MHAHSKTASETFVIDGEHGDYEIHVCLPVTYAKRPDARYPVLYALDANLIYGSVCDSVRIASLARVLYPNLELHGPGVPEMIVVGIGYPGKDPEALARETTMRRIYDFTGRVAPGAPLQEHCYQVSPDYKFGGAHAFLEMLTATVRARIESTYRVEESTRILFGGSAGGHFTTFAMLSRPEAFTHYIIASPAVELCGDDIYALEAQYAKTHDDLKAKVFISFGSRELAGMAGISIASSTARLFESLLKRGYPGLQLHECILQGEGHEGAVPAALTRGLETLLGA